MNRAVLCALGLALGAVAGAQDLGAQLSGEITSTGTWVHTDSADTTSGVVSGWAGLTGGTRDVKTDLRLTLVTLPTPTVTLDRALIKFRFPGLRFTTGWGKVAWGPGFVLPPADLLFDPGEGPNWLGDAYVSLGEEAFFEAAALADRYGARVSAAPLGITLEAAGSWDRTADTWHGALSTQFHLGVDWYAALRYDETPTLSAGAFGTWDVAEGVSLATRHEILAPTVSPAGAAASFDFSQSWSAYDDASLAWEGVSLTLRATGSASTEDWGTWKPSLMLGWKPLQNLTLSLTAPLVEPYGASASVTAGW